MKRKKIDFLCYVILDMTSRTTQWRRRQRVRYFLGENALNDAVPVNLIDNEYVNNRTQSHFFLNLRIQ